MPEVSSGGPSFSWPPSRSPILGLAEAVGGGVLEAELGKAGGSVKIQKMNGRFQEERTYPGSADPKTSKG
jgi:hypothetical protein